MPRMYRVWSFVFPVASMLVFVTPAAFGQEAPSPSEPSESATPESGPPGWPHRGMGERPHFMGQRERMTPDQFCRDRFARLSGYLAYLGVELNLNADQQPLWDAYQKATLEAAGKGRQVCVENMMIPGSHLTVLERRDRFQKMLQARLDFLQSTRQPLEALYQSLSPEQRRLVDRPFMPRMMDRWGRGPWRDD
jgi:LTXXQ motif family protein